MTWFLSLCLVFGLAGQAWAITLTHATTINKETGSIWQASGSAAGGYQLYLINSSVGALKAENLWGALDMLQAYAAVDTGVAGVDWKNPSRVATAVNAPTFTAYRGYKGNGSSSYVDTNYNLTTDGVAYTLNNASLGIFQLDTTVGNNIYGARDGVNDTLINTRSAGGNFNSRINDRTNDQSTISTAFGFSVSDRSGTTKQRFKNGLAYGSPATRASTGVPNTTVKAGTADVSSFSAGLVGMVYAGRSLSSGEHLKLYSIFARYMRVVGAL